MPMAIERPVSVIMTVYNEAGSIGKLLSTLQNQTQPPAEIVIVDGGSSDETLSIISGWEGPGGQVKIIGLSRPGFNISQGRNAAIAAASHEIIAVTDAGTRLPADWLE